MMAIAEMEPPITFAGLRYQLDEMVCEPILAIDRLFLDAAKTCVERDKFSTGGQLQAVLIVARLAEPNPVFSLKCYLEASANSLIIKDYDVEARSDGQTGAAELWTSLGQTADLNRYWPAAKLAPVTDNQWPILKFMAKYCGATAGSRNLT